MANFRKEIEELILQLNSIGIDRRAIEADLDYSEFYLDQILSKGGNEKILKRLQKYHIEKSNITQIVIPPNRQMGEPSQDSNQHESSLNTLIESNRMLVETNKDLTGMLKQSYSNKVSSDSQLNSLEVLRPWLKIIAAGGASKFWKDERAGQVELSKILNEHLDQTQGARKA